MIKFILSFAVAFTQIASAGINTNAPQGGNFTNNIGTEPPTLNPVTSQDVAATQVQNYIMEALLYRDPNSYEWMPMLAEKWEISADKKVYTFFLKKGVLFHDGKPMTADDVKFSFDVIFDPKFETAHIRPYYESIEKVEKVDDYTVKFYVKDNYFKNFDVSAGLTVVPKHVYGDPTKIKTLNKTIIGTGPYSLDKYDKGQKIVLKRFGNWHGKSMTDLKGAYNYDSITLKFVKEENVELEMLKKGDIDYMGMTSEAFNKKAIGEGWGTKAIKVKTENSAPKGFGFIGWNFKTPIFQDRDTRLALYHLVNREEMNKKFRYSMSDLATGPTYKKSDYADQSVKPVEFSPTKAKDLLAKSGWKDEDKNGILEKTINGQKTEFKFTLMHANKDNEKYWTWYKEDLKKAGIEMEIKYQEWNSFTNLLDKMQFEAVALGWGGGDIDWDPKQIWHSASAVEGGSNFISYKNEKVDKLIDQAREELDKKKRIPLMKQVYKMIADDVPYVFMFNDKFTFYGHTSKIQKPADSQKYTVGADYWWITK